MQHIRTRSFCILHSAFYIALALAAASANATPGWTSLALTSSSPTRSPYPRYANALRYPQDRLPYIFTNNNASASASTASSFTDGTILIGAKDKEIKNNSSLFYKLSDDPAGIDLKNVRITTSWSDTGRVQLTISKLFVKTVAGGDAWIELPNSSVSTGKSAKNYQATYADSDGIPIAEGATHLWIYFGPKQQNDSVGYTEIEAEIAFSGDIYLPVTVSPSSVGTVAVSPASPNGDGTYLLNSQVTLTATPAQGLFFYCWQGTVPAGHERDNPLVLTMDDIKTITPIFTPGAVTSLGWVCTNITARNEYPEYINALRGRLPDVFTNNNASVAASTASSFTDGAIALASSGTKYVGNNSSIIYKLSDDPAGVNLRNVRITSSWNDTGRAQIKISKLLIKTAAFGDAWIELPASALTSASSAKNYQATYFDANGALLAEGATYLWIVFNPSQQNNGGAITEIEAEMELAEIRIPLTVNPSPYGTVAVSPASSNGDGTYPLDEVVTLTATPASGFTFHSWTGDVPAGHGFDNPLVLTMDDTKAVTPIFQGPWYYASNVMTDGYWRVTTSLSGGKRTVTSVENIISCPVLDFRKETIGTDAPIVKIDNGVMSSKGWPVRDLLFPDTVTWIGDSCRQMSSLTNLVLSANLANLGHCAFWNCAALRYVTPLLPDTLTSLGGGNEQFSGVPLSGKLVISNKGFTTMGSQMFHHSSGLKEADLSKSGITAIPESVFRSSGVTNVFLPPTVTSIGHCAFYEANSLRSIYFESCPTSYGSSQAMAGLPGNMRIVIYKDDQDWFDFFANGAASFTPWTNLSASVKSNYTFTDRCKPYGRVKIGSAGTEIFVATRSRPNIPLRIMLR